MEGEKERGPGPGGIRQRARWRAGKARIFPRIGVFGRWRKRVAARAKKRFFAEVRGLAKRKAVL
ncbi:MAG: hypothetical protein Q4F13_13645, partial [Pseudomonadota bacterium]|nr:hypothetical protein [Pseudomonadota bacterium]